MFRRCVVAMIVLGAMMAPGLAVAAQAPEPPAEPQDSAALAVLQNELVIRDENLDRQHHEIDTLQNRLRDLDEQLSSAEAAVRESRQRHAAFVAQVHRRVLYGAVALTIIVLLLLSLLLVRRRMRGTPDTGDGAQGPETTPATRGEERVVDDRPDDDVDGGVDGPEPAPTEPSPASTASTVTLDDLDRLFADKPAAGPLPGNQTGYETKPGHETK